MLSADPALNRVGDFLAEKLKATGLIIEKSGRLFAGKLHEIVIDFCSN